jgi:hypothetical protein
MLVVLEGLDDGGLGGRPVAVMLYSETDDFVDAEFERLGVGCMMAEVVALAGI